MNDKNVMISQQARSIAASAVSGATKKNTKNNSIDNDKDAERNYSFAFFVGALISIIAALCLGFMLGVLGVF